MKKSILALASFVAILVMQSLAYAGACCTKGAPCCNPPQECCDKA